MAHGWAPDTPAAIVCGAATPEAWTWTGRLEALPLATPPAGVAGVLVVGEVVDVGAAVAAHAGERQHGRPPAGASRADEVMYGRSG
jgi:siroheme synthase